MKIINIFIFHIPDFTGKIRVVSNIVSLIKSRYNIIRSNWFMHARIGTFNKIPLYLYIPSPLQWFKELLSQRKIIAFIQHDPLYYDQLRAKYEGSISIIPEKDLPKNGQFISWIYKQKIVVKPYFLLLPKLNKLYVLWHEYGHHIARVHDDEGVTGSFHDVIEAFASFYACCKLKLHFNTYIKIKYFSLLHIIGLERRRYNKAHLVHKTRYEQLYFSREIPLNARVEQDYVYDFYRDKNQLISWYLLCFKDLCLTDYHYFFDWNEFLAETGWDNDEERWKYINK